MVRILIVEPVPGNAEKISGIIQNRFEEQGIPPVEISAFNGYLIPGHAPSNDKKTSNEVHVIGFADCKEEAVSYSKSLKEIMPGASIIFILGSSEDINYRARPSATPPDVLPRPVDAGKLIKAIKEIAARWRDEKKYESFIIKSGSVFYRIPFRNIVFFEAKEKKIAVKTDTQEILFYSNFETVMQKLPDSFVRCHKGFIINAGRVSSVDFREMTAVMDDTCMIPVSRVYKDNLMEYLNRQEERRAE